MHRWFKLSLIEVKGDKDYTPKTYRELKEKYVIGKTQTEEDILNKLPESLSFMINKLKEYGEDYFVEVQSKEDERICK